MSSLFVGLISGTSADGIDSALVSFEDDGVLRLVDASTTPYPPELRTRIEHLVSTGSCKLSDLLSLDAAIADAFAAAVGNLLARAQVDAAAVSAIGSHGQTVAHHPPQGTLQLGDPNRIAATLGVPVVADFRRADMAVEGEGAPLAPLFHAAFIKGAGNAILNLGGIANVTIMQDDAALIGFDTGPANTLLDGWSRRHGPGAVDEGGAWAAGGKVHEPLLEKLLDDEYFSAMPPKSTGRERFNMAWLDAKLDGMDCQPVDVQATLAELTARTVADALSSQGAAIREVHACGGGVHNADLMARLQRALDPVRLDTTAALGIDPDFLEAMLFAWLAHERINARSPRGLGSVTGGRQAAVLGGLWLPPGLAQSAARHRD